MTVIEKVVQFHASLWPSANAAYPTYKCAACMTAMGTKQSHGALQTCRLKIDLALAHRVRQSSDEGAKQWQAA